jgi:hypothetical protein
LASLRQGITTETSRLVVSPGLSTTAEVIALLMGGASLGTSVRFEGWLIF